MKPQFHRGDIVLVRFPFTDLSGSKRRPAVVLADYAPDVIVGFISSLLPSVPEPSDVLLHPTDPHFSATGLKKASVFRLRKIATLEYMLVTRRLGRLHQSLLTLVDRALLTGLGVDANIILEEEHHKMVVMLKNEGEKAILSYIKSRA